MQTTKHIAFLIALFTLWGCTSDPILPLDPAAVDTPSFLGETDWVKNFGGSGEDTARSIVRTSDGGYAILGFSNSMDGELSHKTTNVNDYWLLKLDEGGNVLWSRTYGGSKDDRGQSVVQTMDGGYAITGYAMSSDGDGSNNEGFHDNWILKLDAQGNIEWEQSFGFSGHDHSYDLVQTADGGFFFVGFLDITAAEGDGNYGKGATTRHGVGEFWGTKIDGAGNLQWRRYFGGTNNDRAHAVVQANDGGFVMTGFSESDDFDISNTRGSYDFWVIKINAIGELLWERSLGGSGIEIAQDIAKTADNGYVLTGNTFSTDNEISRNHGESDFWLVKINDNGELVWEITYGGSKFDAAESVSLSSDGGFIISGNSKSNDKDVTENAGENDLWILKTDADGNVVWQSSYGGLDLDFGFDAIETSEKDIIVVGEVKSIDWEGVQNKGLTDMVVIKLNSGQRYRQNVDN